MRIIEVEIENFGSYTRKAIFKFPEMITIIQGPNGAGKSTLIEGIFYALFGILSKDDRKDLKSKDYLDIGKPAVIKLLFTAKGKKYRVTRRRGLTKNKTTGKVTRSSTSKLEFLNSKRNPLTTKEAIGLEIEKIMGSKTAVTNSIYSPQGQLHTLLSETGQSLKDQFSNILGLEKYQNIKLAWKGVGDDLKEKRKNLLGNIVKINRDTEDLDELNTQYTQDESDLAKDKKDETEAIQGKKKLILLQGQAIDLVNKIKIENTAIEGLKEPLIQSQEAKRELLKVLDPEITGYPDEVQKLVESTIKEKQELESKITKHKEFVEEVSPLYKLFSQDKTLVHNFKSDFDETKLNVLNQKLCPINFVDNDNLDEMFEEVNLKFNTYTTKITSEFETTKKCDEIFISMKENESTKEIHRSKLCSFLELTQQVLSKEDVKTEQLLDKPDIDSWERIFESIIQKYSQFEDLEAKFEDNISQTSTDIAIKEELVKTNSAIITQLDSGELKVCDRCGSDLTSDQIVKNIKRLKEENTTLTAKIDDLLNVKVDLESKLGEISPDLKLLTDLFYKINPDTIGGIRLEREEYESCINIAKLLNIELEELLTILDSKIRDKIVPSLIAEIIENFKTEIAAKTDLKELVRDFNRYFKDLKRKTEQFEKSKALLIKVFNKYEFAETDRFEEIRDKQISLNERRNELILRKSSLTRYKSALQSITNNKFAKKQHEENILKLEGQLKDRKFEDIEDRIKSIEIQLSNLKTSILDKTKKNAELNLRIEIKENERGRLPNLKSRSEKIKKLYGTAEVLESIFEKLYPKILKSKTGKIVSKTNNIMQEMPSESEILRLEIDTKGSNFDLYARRRGKRSPFHTLSGGEKTSFGFALRVAMSEELSNIGLLILDEPTYGLDSLRRKKLAEILMDQEQIGQLIVITHDDIFDDKTDNILKIAQYNGSSVNLNAEVPEFEEEYSV